MLPSLGSDTAQQAWDGPTPQPDGALFVTTLLWLYTGWDGLGCVAAEVKNPNRTYLRGLGSAMVLDTVVYVLCLCAALDAGVADWEDGYLAVAYDSILPGLGTAIAVSAGLANALLFTVQVGGHSVHSEC